MASGVGDFQVASSEIWPLASAVVVGERSISFLSRACAAASASRDRDWDFILDIGRGQLAGSL